MALKLQMALLIPATFVSLLTMFIDIRMFCLFMGIVILIFSSKTLKRLYVLNFLSDEKVEKFIEKEMAENCLNPVFTSIMAILTNLLTIIFFAVAALESTSVFVQIFSYILVFLWAGDFVKMFFKVTDGEDWTVWDSVFEFFMWFQAIGSILFTIIYVVSLFSFI